MDLRVKNMSLSAGITPVAVMNYKDALNYDLQSGDRVFIKSEEHNTHIIAVVDITHSDETLAEGRVGLFKGSAKKLKTEEDETVWVEPEKKPKSIELIKKKLNNNKLTEEEIHQVVEDIVEGRLDRVELTYFVSAVAVHRLNFEELLHLIEAMVDSGDVFEIGRKPVLDKHCIGGVPGNRTTPIIVPIIAAHGLTIPKTSSRSVTSPAGTADTMDVLTEVSLSIEKMKEVVEETNACMSWGGAIDLAPADDKIIKIERPLSMDISGLMMASILAKKKSVSATHVLIDLPYGKGAKVETEKRAKELKEHFSTLGKLLGMKIKVVLSEGSEPIGRGIGPGLEADDVMKVLQNEEDAPADLKEKSLKQAGKLLEFSGAVDQGRGLSKARKTLSSGKAYKKMKEILSAQGEPGVERREAQTYEIKSTEEGVVESLDNKQITKIARIAGAPVSHNSGLYLDKKKGESVEEGKTLFTIHSESDERLENAKNEAERKNPYSLKTD